MTACWFTLAQPERKLNSKISSRHRIANKFKIHLACWAAVRDFSPFNESSSLKKIQEARGDNLLPKSLKLANLSLRVSSYQLRSHSFGTVASFPLASISILVFGEQHSHLKVDMFSARNGSRQRKETNEYHKANAEVSLDFSSSPSLFAASSNLFAYISISIFFSSRFYNY